MSPKLTIIPVAELSDLHLTNEYNIINWISHNCERDIANIGLKWVKNNIAAEFYQGGMDKYGNMKFFYDKGEYLRLRF